VCWRENTNFSILESQSAREDELDVGVLVFTEEKIELHDLIVAFSPTLIKMISFTNLQLGDLAASRSRVTGFEFLDGTCHSQGKLVIRVHDKVKVSEDDIRNVMSDFAKFEKNSDDATSSRFAAAGRRLITSVSENDATDRYCDLWEACEFILKDKHETRIGGKIVKKISKKIHEITGVDLNKVENDLVRKLYIIRCNVVHNAFDHIMMEGAENDMEIIVVCVMKDHAGIYNALKHVKAMLSKHGLI
jgi:hypothetical protein